MQLRLPWKKTVKTNEVAASDGHRVSLRPVSFRNFYAGALDRLTNSFKGTNLSINESLKRDLDKMRHRSRELVHDVDYGKKYINMVKTNVVGSKGVKLQARSKGSDGLPDTKDNKAIESAFADWGRMENCTVTGKLSMTDVELIAIAAVATDGECLIRFVTGTAYKYGFALQPIEADRLDTQLNRDSVNGGNSIVMSVELDPFEKPVAYYILTKHPSETTVTFGNRKYERIPADEIIHLFKPERIAQSRGIPWMHSAMRRLGMVAGYEEAELVAARGGASKMGFYYTETGEEYKGDDKDANGNLIQEVEPGTIEQLPKNVRFEAYDPQHPTGAYNYFLRGTLRGASAGLNVAYTSLTGDLEAVNYSSIRTGLIEERENWRMLQGWFVEHFMVPVYERWLSAALTRGLIVNEVGVKLPLHKKEKFLNVKWQTRGWAWVDPLKDQQASALAVSSGHMTNSAVVAAQGEDLEEIYETLQWENELATKYGLKLALVDDSKGKSDEKKSSKVDEED